MSPIMYIYIMNDFSAKNKLNMSCKQWLEVWLFSNLNCLMMLAFGGTAIAFKHCVVRDLNRGTGLNPVLAAT